MNLAIRGFAADLGQEPADTFARDQHPDQKFDHILPTHPSTSRTGAGRTRQRPSLDVWASTCWECQYAWLQHMLWKLRPGGEAGVVLANGS